MISAAPIAGLILAGGLGRRMGGGDKPLITVGGRPMLGRVAELLAPQVDCLVINANGDPSRFTSFGLPVVPDTIEGFAGPLAGILAGMRWVQTYLPAARFMASVAADTPFFPPDLVRRLTEGGAGDQGTVALAASADGVHPVFGLWPVALAGDLETFMGTGATGKILAFVDRHRRVEVRFDPVPLHTGASVDPFFNVNTPEDAAHAHAIAEALEGPAE